MKHYTEIVSDVDLDLMISYNKSMFHSKTGREWLSIGLDKVRRGSRNGSGVTGLLEDFKLICKSKGSSNSRKLTKKGLMYLLSVAEEKLSNNRPTGANKNQ